ncbi:MAG: hypothetical protein ACRD2I_19070 [Vicinamibacterales bacterium]
MGGGSTQHFCGSFAFSSRHGWGARNDGDELGNRAIDGTVDRKPL